MSKVIELKPKPVQQEARPPAFSDEALAQQYAETHADDLRYVAAMGRWLSFDGTRWRLDEYAARLRSGPGGFVAKPRPVATKPKNSIGSREQ